MTLWRIAWRYVWNRPLVTLVTLFGIALSAALISSVLTLHRETRRAFAAESAAWDLVVGAKGSPLQLILSSLYHLDVPTGNIPYVRYEALQADSRVRTAVPIGLGDNVRGFRIVGVLPELFQLHRLTAADAPSAPLFVLQQGRFFESDFEAVLGAEVARQTGLALGNPFVGSHGLLTLPGSEEHAQTPYTVVGVLKSMGSANDCAVFVSLASVWKIHEHEAAEPSPSPSASISEPERDEREVTAVLIQLKVPGMRLWMADEINRQTEAMAAVPLNEMLRLYQNVLKPVQQTLLAVAGLVAVAASLTILTTLYQSAERRRRDVALLRALGAHPAEIFALYFQTSMGLPVLSWTVGMDEWAALLGVVLLGLLSGVIPAALAYRRSPVVDMNAL